MADWQKGDLALCVKVGPWRSRSTGEVRANEPVSAGMVLTVRASGLNSYGELVLWFDEVPGDTLRQAYNSLPFRKITPPKADEFDREVIDLMAGKRVSA